MNVALPQGRPVWVFCFSRRRRPASCSSSDSQADFLRGFVGFVTVSPGELVADIEPYAPRAIWAMVLIQWHTGMRSNEVCITRGADIIEHPNVWIYRPREHKTDHLGHHRIVAIGQQGQKVLRPWRREDPEAFLFQPCESEQLRNRKRHNARTTPR